MIVKNGRNGRFLACPGYPECKSVKPFKTGVKCPDCQTGDLVERMSKKGKMFFSCSNYPKCEHVDWNRPIPQACPECDDPYLTLRETQKRRVLACPSPGCKHTEPAPEAGSEVEVAAPEEVAAGSIRLDTFWPRRLPARPKAESEVEIIIVEPRASFLAAATAAASGTVGL